jgi:hypothetical protein
VFYAKMGSGKAVIMQSATALTLPNLAGVFGTLNNTDAKHPITL